MSDYFEVAALMAWIGSLLSTSIIPTTKTNDPQNNNMPFLRPLFSHESRVLERSRDCACTHAQGHKYVPAHAYNVPAYNSLSLLPSVTILSKQLKQASETKTTSSTRTKVSLTCYE
jgi:hypothetical protein